MKALKFIFRLLFPFVDLFKNIKSDLKDGTSELKKFDFWDSNIGWTLKLYTLTIVIPICGTAMIILWNILGQDMIYPFFEGIWRMWSGFYVTGTFLDIAAWRWQLILLAVSFLFTIGQKN